MSHTLPTTSQERKDIPLARGALDYFPAALAAVAELSRAGNEKHNPGEEMHHARGKSTDHADCIARHLLDRGTVDPEDGIRHSVKVAWRALALLQEELEAAGEAPLARGAKLPETEERSCAAGTCIPALDCCTDCEIPETEYTVSPVPESQLPEGAKANYEFPLVVEGYTVVVVTLGSAFASARTAPKATSTTR